MMAGAFYALPAGISSSKLLLPTAFNSHHPSFVTLALYSEQHIHLFCFGAAEQEALGQHLFTDSAPALTAAVNDRVARRTMLFAQRDTNSGRKKVTAGSNRWLPAPFIVAPSNIQN